jgi:SAM-dependent methyltransferase
MAIGGWHQGLGGTRRMIPNVLELAKTFIAQVLPKGGIALDGTVGNGYDTLFLAEQVGAEGKVFGFDIQAEAIERAHAQLDAMEMGTQVTLIHADHALLNEHLPSDISFHAAMYNLGYLPHGDKSIITQSASTLAALGATFEKLVKGGVLTVVIYPGHEGGNDEAQAVLAWARSLSPEQAKVVWYQPLNARRPAPSLIAIGKRGT